MTAPWLVGFAGYARAGKNTAAGALPDHTQVAFADTLKKMALAIDPLIKFPAIRMSDIVNTGGWEQAKEFPEVRRFLQRLGTEGARECLWDTVWVDVMDDRICNTACRPHAITDVRFENEVEMITLYGGVVVWIDRPGVEPAQGHASESDISGICHHRIVNDGSIEDLHNKVRECFL